MAEDKFHALSQMLEQKIRSGELNGRLPGVLRWARELGVHHVTLLKALRLLESRNLVEIIPDTGTFVKYSHRKKYHVIGLLGFRQDPELDKIAESSGYHLLYITMDVGLVHDNPRWILNFPVDALLVRYSMLEKRQIEQLHENGVFVGATYHYPGTDCYDTVSSDYFSFFRTLLTQLKAEGCTKIAFSECDRKPDLRYYLENIRSIYKEVLQEQFRPELFLITENSWTYQLRYGKNSASVCWRDMMRSLAAAPVTPEAVIMPLPGNMAQLEIDPGFLPETKFYFMSNVVNPPDFVYSRPTDGAMIPLLKLLIRRCEGYEGPFIHRRIATVYGNARGITMKELYNYYHNLSTSKEEREQK